MTSRPRIALLSNPKSTGNLAQLPRIREFCAEHPDIFHYEVERANQVGEALKTIARVRPKVLVINGGDGTVQAALIELAQGDLSPYLVPRELIALRGGSGGRGDETPVIGMFLGGAGLADTMLY